MRLPYQGALTATCCNFSHKARDNRTHHQARCRVVLLLKLPLVFKLLLLQHQQLLLVLSMLLCGDSPRRLSLACSDDWFMVQKLFMALGSALMPAMINEKRSVVARLATSFVSKACRHDTRVMCGQRDSLRR
jgi:hypothetical protein